MTKKKKNCDLTIARLYAGLSVSEACQWLGRSERTWQRWEQIGAPEYVFPMLRLIGGDLGLIHPDWAGWYLKNGVLTNELMRYEWTPGDILASWWDRQRLAALERQLRAASPTVDPRGEHPAPPATPLQERQGRALRGGYAAP